MSKLADVQDVAKTTALSVVKKSPTTIKTLQDAFVQHFTETSLLAIRAAFAEHVTENAILQSKIDTVIDATYSVMNDLGTLKRYVTLTIPMMEDGNNFGVTIQLEAIKAIDDLSDKLEKGLDEIFKYSVTRADVLEKCSYPSSSKTTTTTSNESSSTGTDKEKGDTSTTSKSSSKEEKTVGTESVTASPALTYRKKAVIDVDVQYYGKARTLLSKTITGYCAVVDFMSKNKTKLEKPKGSRESGTVYSSMY